MDLRFVLNVPFFSSSQYSIFDWFLEVAFRLKANTVSTRIASGSKQRKLVAISTNPILILYIHTNYHYYCVLDVFCVCVLCSASTQPCSCQRKPKFSKLKKKNCTRRSLNTPPQRSYFLECNIKQKEKWVFFLKKN